MAEYAIVGCANPYGFEWFDIVYNHSNYCQRNSSRVVIGNGVGGGIGGDPTNSGINKHFRGALYIFGIMINSNTGIR